MNLKTYVVYLLVFTLFSCENQFLYICSDTNEDSCITIVTNRCNSKRYLFSGMVKSINKEWDYALINLHGYASYPDGIYVCYHYDSNSWEFVFDRDSIVYNSLNPKIYYLSTSLEKDSLGIPTTRRFNRKNCSVISLYGDKPKSLNDTELIISSD